MNKEVKTLKLGQMYDDVRASLVEVTSDEQLAHSSFIRNGQTVYTNFGSHGLRLCNCKGYENFNERLWVWSCISLEDEINIVAVLDKENGNCEVTHFDLYVQEIIDEHNKN